MSIIVTAFTASFLTGDINPDTVKRILDEGTGLEKRCTVFERSWAATYSHWHDVTGNQPAPKRLLGDNGLSILLAPHRGLESGFSEEVYKAIKGGKPGLVAISEKRHKKDADGTVHPKYRTSRGAVGQYVSIDGKVEERYSVSTQNGHHMLFQFQRASGQPRHSPPATEPQGSLIRKREMGPVRPDWPEPFRSWVHRNERIRWKGTSP